MSWLFGVVGETLSPVRSGVMVWSGCDLYGEARIGLISTGLGAELELGSPLMYLVDQKGSGRL